MMSMSDDEVAVTFTRPTLTPKLYLSKGPSGWPETFKRCDADQALAKFIGTGVTVQELVDVFMLRQKSAEKPGIDWYTITGFLSRTYGMSFKAVPSLVGIAFWAAVIQAQQAQASAEGN